MTVAQAYERSAQMLLDGGFDRPRARLEARLLVDCACQTRHAHLLQPDRVFDEKGLETLMRSVVALRDGEPLAYLTQRREFFGLDFRCDKRALIPRPETETLVEAAVARLKNLKNTSGALVADLGTGTGCIAISVAHALPDARVYATDASPDALELARLNAQLNGVDHVRFVRGDIENWAAPLLRAAPLLDESREARFDAILSNPPYISQLEIETLPAQIRDWEPRLALDGGSDGLDAYRQIAVSCNRLLKPGGFLMLELGAHQFADARLLFINAGWNVETSIRDPAGIERVLVATRKVPAPR